MRRFFLLAADPNQSGAHAVVPNYPLYDRLHFDSSQVVRCKFVPKNSLMPGILLEKPGNPVDLVGNPLCWPIVSPAMLDVFEEYAGEDIQALPLNVVNSSGVAVLTDYRVVNVLRCLDHVLDMEHSVTSCHTIAGEKRLNIITPVFHVDRIPPAIHVFRYFESMFTLVVSQEFSEAIQKAKLKGYALIETGSV